MQYWDSMPWTAQPFEERALQATLSGRFRVRGIPHLVAVGADGAVACADAREAVLRDPEGVDFPWAPPPLAELLAEPLVRQGGGAAPAGALDGKTVAFYFSAGWCAPCRQFTPRLREFYEQYQSAPGAPPLDLVFVSADRDEAAMEEYFAAEHGGWLAVPFRDAGRRRALSSRFGVEGVPTLVAVSPGGATLTVDGVAKVLSGAAAVVERGWEPDPVGDLATPVQDGVDLNGAPAVIAFCEGCDDEEIAEATAALGDVAREQQQQRGGAPPSMLFFVAGGPSKVAATLRAMMRDDGGVAAADTTAPVLALIDIPGGGSFYLPPEQGDVTADGVRALLAARTAGDLPRLQLGRPPPH